MERSRRFMMRITCSTTNTVLDKQQKNQRKFVKFFSPINFNMCFGCSNEPSHLDGSFEYTQHMFWLRNKKIKFSLRTLN